MSRAIKEERALQREGRGNVKSGQRKEKARMRMLLQKSQFGWGGDARKEVRLCLQEKCLGYKRVCTVKGLSFQVKEFRIDEMRFLLNGNLGSCEEVYPKWGEQSG